MEKLAKKIADWIQSGIKNTEENELYYYGILEGLHFLVNVLIMLLMGALMRKMGECVCFYITYACLRIYAGGYHADTRFRCFVCSGVLLFLFIRTVDFVKRFPMQVIGVVALSVVLIAWLAPVGNPNHSLDNKEQKVFRKVALMVLTVYIIFIFVGYFLKWKVITACLMETIIWVAVMLIVGRIKYGTGKKRR